MPIAELALLVSFRLLELDFAYFVPRRVGHSLDDPNSRQYRCHGPLTGKHRVTDDPYARSEDARIDREKVAIGSSHGSTADGPSRASRVALKGTRRREFRVNKRFPCPR